MSTQRVTQSQLSIQPGDTVKVTRDDGTTHLATATSQPWKLGGHTWVVMLSGISGAYDLSRCRKMKLRTLGIP